MEDRDMMEVLEICRCRGLILKNLKQKYPDGVDFEVLRKALELQGHPLSKSELSVLVEYLKDGEYVHVTYLNKKYILVIKISKKGIDLVDALISDIGIHV